MIINALIATGLCSVAVRFDSKLFLHAPFLSSFVVGWVLRPRCFALPTVCRRRIDANDAKASPNFFEKCLPQDVAVRYLVKRHRGLARRRIEQAITGKATDPGVYDPGSPRSIVEFFKTV